MLYFKSLFCTFLNPHIPLLLHSKIDCIYLSNLLAFNLYFECIHFAICMHSKYKLYAYKFRVECNSIFIGFMRIPFRPSCISSLDRLSASRLIVEEVSTVCIKKKDWQRISLINQEKVGSKKEGIAEDESENRSGIFS